VRFACNSYCPSTATYYYSLFHYFVIAGLIVGILFTLAYLISLSSTKNHEKGGEYECGFAPFDNATRLPFDVQFYLVGILFLIFDVEVALLLPWVISFDVLG
jgi:NADH:ubiquinone oxidoreductase subunit 3 (subunit A)